MAHAPKKQLVNTEIDATLERFGRYLMGTRYERKRKVRWNTARTYLGRMRLFVIWAGTLEPTVAQASAYLELMSNGYKTDRTGEPPSDSTKRAAFYTVKAWFEFQRTPLTEEQERDFLVPPMPRNVREMPLDLDTINVLLSRIPDRRRYALVRTLLATGMRRAELAALKIKHIDFDARKVWVPEVGEGGIAAAKGASGGWICISPMALDAIREHLGSRLKPSGEDPEAPVFESLLTYGHLTPDGLTDLVSHLTETVLDKRITCHQFRHAYASHAAAGGDGRPPMSITALQKQMRHKARETTLKYLHSTESLQESYERSSPF
ncbi:MAG: tyrosine-type recombinase/integrase [Thermoplasmatota archaeon]